MTTRYKSCSKIKDQAKIQLEGKYGLAVSVFFLYATTNYVAMLVSSRLDQGVIKILQNSPVSKSAASIISLVLSYLTSAIFTCFLHMFMAGMALFFLKIACDQFCSQQDLFYGFRTEPAKVFALGALVTLPQMIFTMPFDYFYYRYDVSPTNTNLLYCFIAIACGYLVWTFYYLHFALCFFMMVDFPELSAIQLMKKCSEKMKGRKLALFKLQLSFIPLMLLGLLSFGIGLLWIYPYMQESYAIFYLDTMNPLRMSESEPEPAFTAQV